MVRPYEDIQEDKLLGDKFKAFASVVCRLTQDTYKQLNFKVNNLTDADFWIKGLLRYGFIEIFGYNGLLKAGTFGIVIQTQGKEIARNSYNLKDLFGKQTPKDLQRASRLVFNWIKSEMQKIPE